MINARRITALATDYDGTLAWHGSVEESTCAALNRFRESGRKVLLVTGRELHDWFGVFVHPELFDLVVAENGGLLYHPATQATTVLGPPPPRAFVNRLRQQGVHPLSVGCVIVATQENYHGVVRRILNELELDWQIIPNKGALMVLPPGVDKASGLQAALAELQLSAREVLGVGDAENDHAFLRLCGVSAAVANALPALKEQVDYVTEQTHGWGVQELIDKVLVGRTGRPDQTAGAQITRR